MSLKTPQYRASLLPQHGSLHGVHAVMLADTGLPPESRTCMIAHDGGFGCEEAAWGRPLRPAESLAHSSCEGDGHTDGHTAQKQLRRSTGLREGQVPKLRHYC